MKKKPTCEELERRVKELEKTDSDQERGGAQTWVVL
jgi:hypothetical protein